MLLQSTDLSGNYEIDLVKGRGLTTPGYLANTIDIIHAKPRAYRERACNCMAGEM